jgi:hypothetical protein
MVSNCYKDSIDSTFFTKYIYIYIDTHGLPEEVSVQTRLQCAQGPFSPCCIVKLARGLPGEVSMQTTSMVEKGLPGEVSMQTTSMVEKYGRVCCER